MQQDKRYVIFFSIKPRPFFFFFHFPFTVKPALSGHPSQYSIQRPKIDFPYILKIITLLIK